SHILQSKCVSPFICDKTKDTVNGLSSEAAVDLDRVCMCCRYEYLLSMPHMPDMTYANNWLIVDHKTGFSLRFNCLDALRVVSKELPRHLKVDAANDWMKSRADSQYTRFTAKPFDWTFTTDYKGSVVSVADDGTHVAIDGSAGVEFAPTDQRIDIERLKRKDEILYYDDVDLFEDELADHGVAKCSVKIRVMKQSFFILMRFFLRIDNVLVRMNDTRLYHEVGTDFILREYTNREAFVKDLHIPAPVLIDPVQLANHLPLQQTICHKLSFKSSKCVSPFICDKTKDTVNGLSSEAAVDLDRVCMCCRYEYLLSMPHMPDMTYANNWLIVDHKTGFSLRFNCLDALRVVSKELPRHLKVDAADDWMKSRADSQYTRFTAKPFDWTFTTDYKGSAVSVADGTDVATDGSAGVEFAPTDERINIERLKRKDDILFYDDVDLFEDELADHGVAKCSVKIRVMKQSFFILMRFFLRIDNVLVRMNDTRLYHEVGTDFILREYTNREAFVKDLHIPAPVLIDPVQLANHLPLQQTICHKLSFKSV
ncbi:unnamed protein product, partial [Medioppia subpectinata]